MSFSDGKFNKYSPYRPDGSGIYTWISDRGKALYQEFQWYVESVSGLVSTIRYRVVCINPDTQSVNQHCYIKITANGGIVKVEATSPRTNWKNWTGGEGMQGCELLSGTFTVTHNYINGTASFKLRMKSAIYYKDYQCDDAMIAGIPAVHISLPSIKLVNDNGNNSFTVQVSEWGYNLSGTYGYFCIGLNKTEGQLSFDNYNLRKSVDLNQSDYTKYKNITINLSELVSNIYHKSEYSIRVRLYRYQVNQYVQSKKDFTIIVTGYAPPDNPHSLGTRTNDARNKYTPESTVSLIWKASDSPDGFIIRLYKNNSLVKLKGSPSGDFYVDINSSDYYEQPQGSQTGGYQVYPIKLSDYGYNVGDRLKFSLFSYNLNGLGEKLWSGSGSIAVMSGEIKLESSLAYRAHAKNPVDGKWYEVVESYAKNPVDGKWYNVEQFHGKFSNNLFYPSIS